MGMFDVLGGGNRRGGGMSPIALAVLGALAYRTMKGKGRLADLFGTGQGASNTEGAGGQQPRTADIAGENRQPGTARTAGENRQPGAAETAGAGGLGGLLGGLAGGGLGAGLKDLLDRFRQTGHEEQAQSWVSTGENRPIAPPELEDVLGPERIQWLMEQTGLPKEQLLAGLSSELPAAVDKLTPNGKVPTDEELTKQLSH
jgi:uncharacterized protein YidB (DUF937 family)